jgi:hypothetical protein
LLTVPPPESVVAVQDADTDEPVAETLGWWPVLTAWAAE